jgi:hypothetical protein
MALETVVREDGPYSAFEELDLVGRRFRLGCGWKQTNENQKRGVSDSHCLGPSPSPLPVLFDNSLLKVYAIP